MASSFAWGIDIGNRALKALKLVRDGDGVRIDDFDIIEHEFVLSNAGDNRETLIQTALASFASRHPMKNAHVAVGVSGQQSFARFIKLPPVEPKKIPEIVRFEAIQQIPFPLDEVEWSYQLFQNEGSPDVEVGIFAMRKDLVNQHLQFFAGPGLNVQVVQMNPLADYNALYYDGRLSDGTTMIIDLGAENADLIITEGEQIWMRSIPIGGNHFTEALVKAFKLRFEKAEELKRNAATSKYGRQILQAMRPVFADLVSEIQRSIGFYSSVHRDSRISKVLALGGTFKLPGLQKYLQQNLSLDVTKVDGLGNAPPTDAKVAGDLNDNILSAVGAYGLALQALGKGKIGSSLLPRAIQRERMWKEKTKWFAAAAAACVACPILAGATYYMQAAKYESAKPTRDEINRIYQQGTALAGDWKKLESAGAGDRQLVADIKGLGEYRDLWPELYKEIASTVPPTSDKPPAKPGGADDRRILLEQLQAEYMDDIGPVLALAEDQFKLKASKRDWSVDHVNTTAGPGGGGYRAPVNNMPLPANAGHGGGAFQYPGYGNRGYGERGFTPLPRGAGGVVAPSAAAPVTATPAPAATDTGGGDATAAAKGRGFLITLHTATPNPNPVGLITTGLVDRLKQIDEQLTKEAKAKGASAKGRTYKIERITIPTSLKFSLNPERQAQLMARVQAAANRDNRQDLVSNYVQTLGGGQGFTPGFTPPPAGGGGAAPPAVPPGAGGAHVPPPAGGGRPAPAAPMPAQPPRMPMPTAAGSAAAVGPNGEPVLDPFVDPVTKENLKDWSDVVVLMVVRVDPDQAADAGADTTGAAAAPAAAPRGAAATPAPAAPVTPPPKAPAGGRPNLPPPAANNTLPPPAPGKR